MRVVSSKLGGGGGGGGGEGGLQTSTDEVNNQEQCKCKQSLRIHKHSSLRSAKKKKWILDVYQV